KKAFVESKRILSFR
ncbi:unnamed protein product, partial [Oikopleura dioica]